MSTEIIVVTGAYGRQQVAAAGGQQALLPVIERAGASGVEIRRELFSAQELSQLPALSAAIKQHGLTAYYSVPEPLFTASGTINPDLQTFFAEAGTLNARLLKFSSGYPVSNVAAEKLAEQLAASPVPVTVENDQTDGGKIAVMAEFFSRFGQIPAIAGMTFDTGNWYWTGESPLRACRELSAYVSYIHLKAVRKDKDGFRAVPPAPDDEHWQTLLAALPGNVPRGIEFPLTGEDLVAVTRQYVDLFRQA